MEKEWTIMVYMAGDNDLSEDMITGLKGMMNIGSEANINLVALYDGSYPSAPIKFYEFSKEINRNHIGNGRRHRLEDFDSLIEEELAAGAGNSRSRNGGSRRKGGNEVFKIKDFVPRVMKKFPAKKYALILSGHSDGVIGRRLLPDGDSDLKLNLSILRKLLEDVLPAEDGKRKKLDIIGFDGCLMGMLEVGFELKDVAKILVASEGNIPATGWMYNEMLAELVEKKGALNEKEFAVSLVKSYVDYNEDFAIGGRSINISACNLEALNKEDPQNNKSLYDNIQHLAKLFYDILNLPTGVEDREPTADEAVTFKENQVIKEKFIDWMILSHYRSQTFMHSQAVDIVDFTYNILIHFSKWMAENEIMGIIKPHEKAENTEYETLNRIQDRIVSIFNSFVEINEAIRVENETYILRSCSIGAEYQFSQGVSLFFPWTRLAFRMIRKPYSELKFNETANWFDFINWLTALTVREYSETPLFDKDVDSLFTLSFDEMRHREVIGREVIGREVIGREVIGREVIGRGGFDGFYYYFSQIRNYRTDVFGTKYVDKTSFVEN